MIRFIAFRDARLIVRFYNNSQLPKEKLKLAFALLFKLYKTGIKRILPNTLNYYESFEDWYYKTSILNGINMS